MFCKGLSSRASDGPLAGPTARPNATGVITHECCFLEFQRSQHFFEAQLIGPPPGDLILARWITAPCDKDEPSQRKLLR